MVNSILVVKLKFDNHAKQKKKKNYEMPSNMLSEIWLEAYTFNATLTDKPLRKGM